MASLSKIDPNNYIKNVLNKQEVVGNRIIYILLQPYFTDLVISHKCKLSSNIHLSIFLEAVRGGERIDSIQIQNIVNISK